MSVFQPTSMDEWVRDQTKRVNLHDRKGRVTRRTLGLPRAQASGIVNNDAVAGGSAPPIYWNVGVTIVFPVGLFDPDGAPVVVQAQIEALGGISWCSLISIPTATSVTVRSMRTGTAPVANQRIHWTATQEY